MYCIVHYFSCIMVFHDFLYQVPFLDLCLHKHNKKIKKENRAFHTLLHVCLILFYIACTVYLSLVALCQLSNNKATT
jgi:quinol-cytochrome oxidoreductase complex cytochrome b subunit